MIAERIVDPSTAAVAVIDSHFLGIDECSVRISFAT